MFADPQVVTVNSVAKSMPRILMDGLSAQYSTSDSLYSLKVSHQKSNARVRTMVRFDQRAIVPDPLTSVNDWETLGVYFVIDRPEVGFTLANIQQNAAGLWVWGDATAIGKLVGGES